MAIFQITFLIVSTYLNSSSLNSGFLSQCYSHTVSTKCLKHRSDYRDLFLVLPHGPLQYWYTVAIHLIAENPSLPYHLQVHIFLRLSPPLVAFPETALCISFSNHSLKVSVPQCLPVLFFPHVTLSWASSLPMASIHPLCVSRGPHASLHCKDQTRTDHPSTLELTTWLRPA